MVAPVIYEQGTRFEKWTILEEGPKHKAGKQWLCKCECGFERLVLGTRLRFGKSKSCGCDSIKATRKALWKGYGEIGLDLWSSYKRGAEKRGYEFQITIEEMWELFLTQERLCALTGLPLEMFSYRHFNSTPVKNKKGGITGRRTHGTASLDRIDNTKGYDINNIHWVHKDINIMKKDHSLEYFLSLCQKVVDHNK